MACADGVEQVLELSGRGAFNHACHQRVSVAAGVSQLRTRTVPPPSLVPEG